MAEPTLQSPSVPEPLPAPPVAAHEMTDAERTTWMRDGTMPEREVDDGASTTPEPAEQAASTDVNGEADSEPAAPGTKGKKSKSKGAGSGSGTLGDWSVGSAMMLNPHCLRSSQVVGWTKRKTPRQPTR